MKYQLQQHLALLVALGVAVIVHGLLWVCWPHRKVTITEQEERPALTVQLAWPNPILKVPRLVLPHADARLDAQPYPVPHPLAITLTTPMTKHDDQDVNAHSKHDAPIAEGPSVPSAALSSPVATNGWALRTMALQMAKEEGKRIGPQTQDSQASLAWADRPIVPALAAAMNPHKTLEAGVTMSPDGMVKVVNAQGQAYCMMTVSQGPKTGPLEPDAIPMTCP